MVRPRRGSFQETSFRPIDDHQQGSASLWWHLVVPGTLNIAERSTVKPHHVFFVQPVHSPKHTASHGGEIMGRLVRSNQAMTAPALDGLQSEAVESMSFCHLQRTSSRRTMPLVVLEVRISTSDIFSRTSQRFHSPFQFFCTALIVGFCHNFRLFTLLISITRLSQSQVWAHHSSPS